jgi:hypothetical protein
MSLNKKDRQDVVKEAKNNDYRWSSDGSKMINDAGKSVSFSDTGNSVKIGGTTYSTASDAKKSSKW